MPVTLEEGQKFLADLVTGHSSPSFSRVGTKDYRRGRSSAATMRVLVRRVSWTFSDSRENQTHPNSRLLEATLRVAGLRSPVPVVIDLLRSESSRRGLL
jgi:hypothetical protein